MRFSVSARGPFLDVAETDSRFHATAHYCNWNESHDFQIEITPRSFHTLLRRGQKEGPVSDRAFLRETYG
jgi:hypothetical protein